MKRGLKYERGGCFLKSFVFWLFNANRRIKFGCLPGLFSVNAYFFSNNRVV